MKIKEKIFSKYTIYVFCFVVLNFFDVIRDMQIVSLQIGQNYISFENVFPGYKMGDVWMIVENLVGIIMMIVVLSGYKLKAFISKSNLVWTILCFFAMVMLPFVRTGKYGTILVQEELAIVNVWWIFLVAKQIFIKYFRKREMPIKFNVNVVLWIILTFCMIFSVASSRVWPIFYLGMFGCFYLTEYKKQDVICMFNAMIDGTIWAFVIMQSVACFLRPYDSLRYPMLYSDCTATALYYLIVYVMLLAKIHILIMGKDRFWKKMLCVLGQGCVLALLFMTGGRAAWGVTIVVTAFYGVVVIKKIWNKNWLSVLIRGVVLVSVALIMFIPMFWMVRWIPTSVPARLWYQEEIAPEEIESEVFVGESKYSQKYVDLDEMVGYLLRRFNRSFEIKPAYINVGDLYMTNSIVAVANGYMRPIAIADFSSKFHDKSLKSRIEIFNAYFEKLTWWGNNPSGQEAAEMRYHAHNLYLQIAYIYGIPAGVLLIIIAITLMICQFKTILKSKNNPYAIIPYMISLVFFGVGIMGVVWVTGRLIMFMLFFVQFPFRQNEDYTSTAIEGK